jgi:hypothetical protein
MAGAMVGSSALILNHSRPTSSNLTQPGASQLRLAYKEFLARPKSFGARDLKLSRTAARTRLLTTIAISDIGIWSTMSQAITEATLCLTADAGRMAIPRCASTSEISVEISAAVWETLGTILASRSIPKIRSWIRGDRYAHTSRSPDPTLRLGAPFSFLPVYGTRVPRVRTVRDAL